MNVTRRQALTSIAALTCGYAVSPAFASKQEVNRQSETDKDGVDFGDTWSNPGFIRLQTLTRLIQINNLILITTFAIYFVRFLTLQHSLTRHNENRVSVPKSIPLLGGLFEETYERDDFRSDLKLGRAYTYDNSLILDLVPNRPQTGEDSHPKLDLNKTITDLDNMFPSLGQNFSLKLGEKTYSSERIDLLNDDFSYRIPSMETKALSGSKHPLTYLSDIPVLSSFFKNPVGEVYGGKNLHVLIRPSIVADY